MPKSPTTIIIIGAGLSGLASASLLARQGFDVTVLEKNDQIGGRVSVWKQDGFVFDLGPSWYMMTDVFEQFFAQFGQSTKDYFTTKRLDPSYRVWFEDEHIDVQAGFEPNRAVFDRLEPKGAVKVKKYLQLSHYLYDKVMGELLMKEYRSVIDLIQPGLIVDTLKHGLLRSYDALIKADIRNPKLQRMLLWPTVFLGGTPKLTPALYAMMGHIDYNLGTHYPMGGMGKISTALYQLALSQGVKFKLNHEVTRLNVDHDQITSVTTANGEFTADMVLGSAEYHHIETELLDRTHQSYPQSWWNKQKIGPATVLFYLGVNKKLRNIRHHNYFFSPAWDEHFVTIEQTKTWPTNPSYYVCAGSVTDPAVAPKGCENLFVLVPVAAGLDDSDAIREKLYNDVLGHFENIIGEPIRPHVTVKRIASHRDQISLYHSYLGSALGLSHSLWQTAIFRPSHRSRKVKNLFYTGHDTHPGIGMPMVLISAQIVAKIMGGQHE